ncbi:MAG: ADP-ribosylglycohydrolase family protein [Bacteroidota bacterium]
MLGTITGDIIGSRFEKNNHRSLDFELFHSDCRFTDDTVLTVAVAQAILEEMPYGLLVREYARAHPFAGYGGTFKKWMLGLINGAYNSWGNGSAMRVSAVGWAFNDLEQVLTEARKSAEITHNHPEGVKGAQAIATAIFLARKGKSKQAIKTYITETFAYNLDRTIADIRPEYRFDVSCQGSVPEAIIAFLEAEDFEQTIRLAISLGGDSDTIAAMAGGIAEAYYGGIPTKLENEVRKRLPEDFLRVIHRFYQRFI